jgi:Mce-associated membrane protein
VVPAQSSPVGAVVIADLSNNGSRKVHDASVGSREQVDTPAPSADDALALAEQAEAEAAAAEAAAAAARARVRAIRLRQQGQGADAEPTVDNGDGEPTVDGGDAEPAMDNGGGEPAVDSADGEPAVDSADGEPAADSADGEPAVDSADGVEDAATTSPSHRWWRRVRRPRLRTVAVVLAAIAVTGASLGASGYIVSQHRNVSAQQRRTAEFAAAARQSVVTLMTMDFHNAKQDVQRVIDDTTGQFKADFQNAAQDLINTMQQGKVTTEVTVNATAVQSMTDDSAVVLVSATSKVTNSAGANQEPRPWRLSVTINRDSGQLKMSRLEFVP